MAVKAGLLALGMLLALPAAPAAADVKAGVDAWNSGDYAKAVDEWRPLASRGNAIAQYNMGQAYRFGRGVAADLDIARSWFEKAAAQGHEQAQAALGLILFQSGDRATALYWIGKAAARGDPRAQYVLGTAHFNGDGVARDWPRAYALMTRAAAKGLSEAAESLREMNKHMLLADRQKGADLARQMEQGRPLGGSAAIAAPPEGPRIVLEPRVTADAGVLSTPRPAEPAPKPKPAAVAASTPRAPLPGRPGGRWRVQLGAFGSPAEARSRWTAMAARIPALAGLTPSYEPFGRYTRLRVGPLRGKAEAERLCAAARAARQDCFPVAP